MQERWRGHAGHRLDTSIRHELGMLKKRTRTSKARVREQPGQCNRHARHMHETCAKHAGERQDSCRRHAGEV
eukprot:2399361-Alexandrium_andersonii.AAC.1